MAVHRDHLSPEGQITIPAEIRKELGIEPGQPVTIAIEEGRIVVDSAIAAARRLAGSLDPGVASGPLSIEEMEEVIAEGWIEDELQLMDELGIPRP